jgi:D-alanyl-D-alanine dipeptidase
MTKTRQCITYLLLALLMGASAEPPERQRPDDFVVVQTLIPDLQVDLRYFGTDNFIGRPIAGYEAPVLLLTAAAAAALQEVQQALAGEGLGLKAFDAYRPQRAVDDFMRWAADPLAVHMKGSYYPNVDKSALIPQGYIAERSGHSRGSTIDLTLVDLSSGAELDMGSPYDYFDPLSWPTSEAVTPEQFRNRQRLRASMLEHGFRPLAEEWWHFTLENEPYPTTYFDFPVR